MMDDPKSLAFSIELSWDKKSGGHVNLGEHGSLMVDALPEFGGEGIQPCPDELFLASLGGCLLTTFLYVRRKLKLPLIDLRISVGGGVRLQGSEGYRLTSVEVVMHVKTLREYEARAEECVRLTESFCHLTRLIGEAVPLRLSAKIECAE